MLPDEPFVAGVQRKYDDWARVEVNVRALAKALNYNSVEEFEGKFDINGKGFYAGANSIWRGGVYSERFGYWHEWRGKYYEPWGGLYQNLMAIYKRKPECLPAVKDYLHGLVVEDGVYHEVGRSRMLRVIMPMVYPEAAANFESITGYKPEAATQGWGRSLEALKGWQRIKKGSDLFVKGLGGFEIDRAIAHIKNWYFNRYVPQVPAEYFQYMPVQAPRSIRYQGYFHRRTRHSWDFAPMLGNKLIGYTRRWWVQLKEMYDRFSHLDALNMCRERNDLPEGWQNIPPARLLDICEERDQTWYVRTNLGNDKTLGDPYYSDYIKDWTFEDLGGLLPVRNFEELSRIAQQLHNCARGYHNQLRNGLAYMFYTVDESGRARTLGMGSDGKWSQVYGACNQSPMPSDRALFYNMSDNCAGFHRAWKARYEREIGPVEQQYIAAAQDDDDEED